MPGDGSSTITSYIVEIRAADGSSFFEDTVSCDGSDPTIKANLACLVPIATLQASPFDLPWGSSVYARITAINIVGPSEVSNEGSNAIILTEPDAPVSFQNEPAIT